MDPFKIEGFIYLFFMRGPLMCWLIDVETKPST
jgi:hypothetical protein